MANKTVLVKRQLFFILIPFCLIACTHSKIKTNKKDNRANIAIKGKYKVCDACKTTIIVGHNECTDCADLQIDSGVIGLSHSIINQIAALKKDTGIFTPNVVSASDLYLADKSYFYKLWPDTINFRDFYKVYRVTGEVTAAKHRVFNDGRKEPYPSFYFRVDKATEIDTAHAKKIKQ